MSTGIVKTWDTITWNHISLTPWITWITWSDGDKISPMSKCHLWVLSWFCFGWGFLSSCAFCLSSLFGFVSTSSGHAGPLRQPTSSGNPLPGVPRHLVSLCWIVVVLSRRWCSCHCFLFVCLFVTLVSWRFRRFCWCWTQFFQCFGNTIFFNPPCFPCLPALWVLYHHATWQVQLVGDPIRTLKMHTPHKSKLCQHTVMRLNGHMRGWRWMRFTQNNFVSAIHVLYFQLRSTKHCWLFLIWYHETAYPMNWPMYWLYSCVLCL